MICLRLEVQPDNHIEYLMKGLRNLGPSFVVLDAKMSTVDMVEDLGRQDCRGCEFCFMIIATGVAPASFMGLMKSMDNGLGFAKTSDFIKFSDMKRHWCISVLNIAELRPASERSPLLDNQFLEFRYGKFATVFTVDDATYVKASPLVLGLKISGILVESDESVNLVIYSCLIMGKTFMKMEMEELHLNLYEASLTTEVALAGHREPYQRPDMSQPIMKWKALEGKSGFDDFDLQ
ncbi:hypothetical protein Tco_0605626 [Tanacetum coccineum]